MAYPRSKKPDLLVRAFQFARWAAALERPPTRLEVQGFLQCSGPMAARWRRTWLGSLPDRHPSARAPHLSGGNRPGKSDTTSEKPYP